MVIMLKPIHEYLGYFAGDDGEIYSTHVSDIPRKLKKWKHGIASTTGRELTYWTVAVYSGDKRYTRTVAYLVLTAFVSPRPIGMEVCHGIRGRFDDKPDNLSWGTRTQNMQDRRRDGTVNTDNIKNRGEGNGRARLTEQQIKQVRQLYSPYGRSGFSTYAIAKRFHVTRELIRDIVHNKIWKHVK